MTRSAVSAAIGLTRRRLLAASAGASALAGFGLPVTSRAAAALPDGEVMNAAHWGVFYVKVEGGRFVGVRPWEKDPRPSPMLPGVQDIVYGPTRIRYPMVGAPGWRRGRGWHPRSAVRATSCVSPGTRRSNWWRARSSVCRANSARGQSSAAATAGAAPGA